MGVRRRHEQVEVHRTDPSEQFALIGIAWNDHPHIIHGGLTLVQPQVGFAMFRVRSVAMKTAIRQNRQYIATELDRIVGDGLIVRENG